MAAAQKDDPLARFGEVREDRTLLVIGENLRSHGHFDDQIVAAGARLVLPGAALAAGSTEMLGVAEVDERIEAGHGLEHDVAALASVSAVGSAELDELLAQEGYGAGSTIAGAHIDLGLVEEFHAARLFTQAARVSSVSIWRTSSPRARQSSGPTPVSTKPNLRWMARDALLK